MRGRWLETRFSILQKEVYTRKSKASLSLFFMLNIRLRFLYFTFSLLSKLATDRQRLILITESKTSIILKLAYFLK